MITSIGSDPSVIKWNVTRGNTSKIRIDFLGTDEVTPFDISTWDFIATAYYPKNDTAYELEIATGTGYVEITALPDVTIEWGAGYGSIIGELLFDVQATIGDTVWTPVVGTISVIGNVTGVL